MARPREWDRGALLEALLTYIEATPIPILAGFAHEHGVLRTQLYEMSELSDAIKACAQKKEHALEQMALKGQVNCTMAIFSLKQLGWKDTHEQTHKTDGPMIFTLSPHDIPPNPKTG